MAKTLITGLAVPLIILAGAAAISSANNLRLYQQHQQAGLADVNRLLLSQHLQLRCEPQPSGWLQQQELCSLTELGSGQVLTAVHHQVQAWPLSLQGQFGFSRNAGVIALVFMTLPQLLDGEEGRWHLNIWQNRARFHYRSGAVDASPVPGTHLRVSPLSWSGEADISPPYQTRMALELPELQVLNGGSGDIALQQLSLSTRLHLQDGVALTERLQWSLHSLSISHPDLNLNVRGLSLEQATLLDEPWLSGLTRVALDAVRLSSPDHDLRIDPTHLSLFVDRIHWPAYQAWMQSPATADGLAEIVTQGMTLTLEELHSSFVYQDRRPHRLGTAGDLRARGRLTFSTGQLTERDDWLQRLRLELHLDASRSLLLGPQAELMLDSLNQGWLHEQQGRIHSTLRVQRGKLTANELPVSLIEDLPDYSEDH